MDSLVHKLPDQHPHYLWITKQANGLNTIIF